MSGKPGAERRRDAGQSGQLSWPKQLAGLACATTLAFLPEFAEAAKVRTQYVFAGEPSGSNPSGLLAANGVLFGTTTNGGGSGCNGKGCGTVFTYDPVTGAYATLYAFGGRPDGAEPGGNLVLQNGILYGTTTSGGKSEGCGHGGCGTVFAIDITTGTNTTLQSFDGSSGGARPNGGVTFLKGQVWGVTSYGGQQGGGVLFSVDTATGRFRVRYALTQRAAKWPVRGRRPVTPSMGRSNPAARLD